MGLSTVSAGALVVGASAPPPPQTQRVRLLRAICVGGARVEAGEEFEATLALARELKGAEKAEFVQTPAAEAPAAGEGTTARPARAPKKGAASHTPAEKGNPPAALAGAAGGASGTGAATSEEPSA